MTNFTGTGKEKTALSTFTKLVRATETLTAATHRHLTEHNLTISQFGVLEALYHLGPMCQKEIARKILKSTGNITTVIDNLEKRTLVTRVRSAEDRRYITIHLTLHGKALIEQVFPVHMEGIVKSLSTLKVSEQRQLAKLCKKLGLSIQCTSAEGDTG